MGVVPGKNNQILQANSGAGGSSVNVILPAAPSGSKYLVDWIAVCVRNAAAANALIEISVVLLEGTTPVVINVPITPSGIAQAGGTYGVFLSGLGLPAVCDGSTLSATVIIRDNTGAGSNTTVTNGLILTTWGLKQLPYQYMG
jgi:hypothetical protein